MRWAISSIHEIAARLTDRRLTLAVAESASGGLIAAQLTSLPGSSAYFRGGIVAYDDRSKTEILGIPQRLFVDHGSVSAEAALALAGAARRVFEADIGIGETSVAGPGGGTSAKPVGLSYVAVVTEGCQEVRENRFTSSREGNREAAVDAALALLAEVLIS